MEEKKEEKIDVTSFLEDEKVSDIRHYSNGEWLNIIVGTVRSRRHISGILRNIKSLKLIRKDDVLGVPESEWVICSIGNVDVHLFSQAKRDYYEIDELWGKYEL